MEANKRLDPMVVKLFMRGKKPNIRVVFFIKILFCSILNCKTKCNTLFYYENTKLIKSALNHSFDVEFKDFMKLDQP